MHSQPATASEHVSLDRSGTSFAHPHYHLGCGNVHNRVVRVSDVQSVSLATHLLATLHCIALQVWDCECSNLPVMTLAYHAPIPRTGPQFCQGLQHVASLQHLNLCSSLVPIAHTPCLGCLCLPLLQHVQPCVL